jgi:predicted metal-dependent peptidase
MDRLNRQTAEAIREHGAKNRGTMPAELSRWADDILKPAKIPWGVKLSRAVRAACGWRAGAVQHRWDGPGRRQAGIGYGPGKPVMPRLRQPTPCVAIAIDTSGSMGERELTTALREANGALKAVGAEVDFVSCDTKVHGLGKIKRIEDAAALCKGGGGTDFRPVFEALEKRRPKPEVVIFATDGYGPAPERQPNGMKTIWLLIGGTNPPAPWGEAIVVEEEKT